MTKGKKIHAVNLTSADIAMLIFALEEITVSSGYKKQIEDQAKSLMSRLESYKAREV